MMPDTLEVCRTDLFTDVDTLRQKFPDTIVDRVLRIRDLYNHILSYPETKDKDAVNMLLNHFPGIGKSTAYADLGVIKRLMPLIAQSSRDFNRWQYNEAIWETYRMAKARKDTKTMERCLTSFAKYNGVEKEAETQLPYEKIVPQPFCATLDVRVLGIDPIPDVFNVIERLTKEMAGDNREILDVEAESADLEEDKLFAPLSSDEHGENGLLQPPPADGAAGGC